MSWQVRCSFSVMRDGIALYFQPLRAQGAQVMAVLGLYLDLHRLTVEWHGCY